MVYSDGQETHESSSEGEGQPETDIEAKPSDDEQSEQTDDIF